MTPKGSRQYEKEHGVKRGCCKAHRLRPFGLSVPLENEQIRQTIEAFREHQVRVVNVMRE
jgi:hypothetical protein